ESCSGPGPSFTGCAYNGQVGAEGIDFHDGRTGIPPLEGERVFRTDDPVRTLHSTDNPRAKYVAAGGSAAGYYETIVGGSDREIQNGDWLNYSRNIPAG